MYDRDRTGRLDLRGGQRMHQEPIAPYTPPTPDLNDTAAAWGPRPSLRKILIVVLILAIVVVARLLLH